MHRCLYLQRDLALVVHIGLSMIYVFLAFKRLWQALGGRQWIQMPATVIKMQLSTTS